jgi:ribose 1,5-bisphosphokinase PhnN
MRNPDLQSLVLVGPPRGGKDTLLGNVAEEFKDEVIVPERWSTRPYHNSPGKMPSWTHQNPADFEEGIATKMISPWWTRAFADIGESPVYYGFLSVNPNDDRLRIYSANYPLLERPDADRRLVLARAMVVVATAHPTILHQRLDEIASEMSPQEKQARSRKIDQNAPQVYRPAEVIDTGHMEPHEGRELFRNLVKDILNGWTPRGYSVEELYLTEDIPNQDQTHKLEIDEGERIGEMSRKPLGS